MVNTVIYSDIYVIYIWSILLFAAFVGQTSCIQLVSDEQKAQKLISKTNFKNRTIFNSYGVNKTKI